MIGQIDIEKTLQLQPNKECLFMSVATVLNHVVDVVNEIMTWRFETDEDSDWYDDPKQREPADTYAEQRKWIGKLCKFWDGNEQMSHLRWGILYTITPTSPLPFCCSLGDGKTFDYEHCEPVKPDDYIIYRGE